MSVELILSAVTWVGLDAFHMPLSSLTSIAGEKAIEFAFNWEFDWACIRSPFLGVQGSKAMIGGVMERMAYFGWVWEPGDSLNVSTATKADEAEVDLSLWNVGRDGPGMEAARAVIRNWLHSKWRRSITAEAAQWIRAQGVVGGNEQLSRNRDAIVDCITRAANSTWWDWSDGSRLFFWRWPEAWRIEVRDGA
jgi:hypothetical protein